MVLPDGQENGRFLYQEQRHLSRTIDFVNIKYIVHTNVAAYTMWHGRKDDVMQKRHENALSDLLEQVAYEGYSAVEKWRITRWYGQERFSVGIRRDVRDRWAELASELPCISGKALVFAEVKGQIVLMHNQVFFDQDE